MGLPKAPDLVGQLINGTTFDHSSLEFTVKGSLIIAKFSEISYEDSLTPGVLRGADSRKLGRTRGEYDASGSTTLYKPDALAWIAILGNNYMEVPFDATLNYGNEGGETFTDELRGCRITTFSDSSSTGGDALMAEVSLDIMEIVRNGLSGTGGTGNLAGIGAAIGGALGSL